MLYEEAAALGGAKASLLVTVDEVVLLLLQIHSSHAQQQPLSIFCEGATVPINGAAYKCSKGCLLTKDLAARFSSMQFNLHHCSQP